MKPDHQKKPYPDRENGEAITIDTKEKYFKDACCDCGLVHRHYIDVHKDGHTITRRVVRDNRATGQIRRWMRSK